MISVRSSATTGRVIPRSLFWEMVNTRMTDARMTDACSVTGNTNGEDPHNPGNSMSSWAVRRVGDTSAVVPHPHDLAPSTHSRPCIYPQSSTANLGCRFRGGENISGAEVEAASGKTRLGLECAAFALPMRRGRRSALQGGLGHRRQGFMKLLGHAVEGAPVHVLLRHQPVFECKR